MRFRQLTTLALLTGHGFAAPTTQNPDASSLAGKADPLIAAGKMTPFNPTWNYCQTKCDCAKRFDKDTQRDKFFQCITDPNCEQCARSGMGPAQV